MVIFNFYPISMGGGLQNALNFLNVFSTMKESFDYKYLIICKKRSDIERVSSKFDMPYISITSGLLGRLYLDFILIPKLNAKFRIACVFTLFGPPPLITSSNIFKISGFAYSNIIQKEIDFWRWLPYFQRLKKYFIDCLRCQLVKKANIIILETDYLYNRAKNSIFKNKDLRVVKMSPSSIVVDSFFLNNNVKDYQISNPVDVLYLAGPHPNKRIHLLAPLFKKLNDLGLQYRLVTTLPSCAYLQDVINSFNLLDIGDKHINIGPINPHNVAKVINEASAVINVAELESFSNNWVEAWAACRPLLVTDAEWARASCGDAALYIDMENPIKSSHLIHSVLSSKKTSLVLLENGKKMLSQLPTSEQRVHEYLNIIKNCCYRCKP